MISVLYVDDDQALLEIGKLFLEESRDFSVTTIDSATAALGLLQQEQFDAIISDYQMPGMDGIAFLKEVRGNGNTIPFIIFTGRGREEIVIQALNEGADFYLQKGGDPQPQYTELAHKVIQAVGKKRTEKALRESEERYRNIVEDQTELISRFLPDGTHIFVNEAYCRYFGYTRNDILGNRFRPSMFPEDRERVSQFLHSLTPENPVGIIEHRIIMADGTVRWQRWSDRGIFNTQGTVREFQSVGRDITELKKAEEELRKSERKFRSLFDNAILGVFQTTPDGRYINMNPAFAKIYGYSSPGEMIPVIHDIQQQLYVHPEDRQKIRELLSTVGEIRNFETENRFRDGSSIWISINAKAARDENGKIIAYEGTIEDITSRRNAELELHRKNMELQAANEHLSADEETLAQNYSELEHSRQVLAEERWRLQNIIEGTNAGTWEWNVQTGETVFNERWADIVGYKLEELSPVSIRTWEKLTHPDDLKKSWELLEQHFAGELAYYECECRMKHKNGHWVWILDRGKIFTRSPDGKPLLMFGTHQDITERIRTEEEIQFKNTILSTQQESTLDGILIVDNEGKVLNFNQKFVSIWGIPDEIMQLKADEPMLDYVMDQLADPEAFISRVRYLYDNKEEKSFEEINLRDGRVLERFSAPMIREQGCNYGRVWYFRDITRRKQAEEKLTLEKTFIDAIFNSVPGLLYLYNAEGKLVRWNKNHELMTGYSAEELANMQLLDWYKGDAESQNAVIEGVKTTMQNGFGEAEANLQRKDGTKIPMYFTASPLTINGKQYFTGIGIDISGRKRSEADIRSKNEELTAAMEELESTNKELIHFQNVIIERERLLQESESRYRSLFQNMGSSFSLYEVILDERGIPCDYRFLALNPEYEKSIGIEASSLIGKTLLSVFPGTEPVWMEKFKEVYLTGLPARIENYSKEVNKYFELIVYSPQKGQLALIGSDITDRKKAEETLHISLIKYQTLFDTFPLGITISDTDGNIIESNQTAETLLGLPKAEHQQRMIDGREWKIIQSDGSPMPPEKFASVRALKEHRIISNVEMGIVKPGGDVNWISVSAAPVPLEGYGVAITYGDVTERKKVEDAFRNANRQLKLLSGITRHDINNKISVILGNLDIAAKKSSSPAIKEYIGKIKSATLAIQSQIEFTKLYQDLGTHEPQWQDVGAVLPRSQIPVTITFNANVTGLEIFTDPMLEKVFSNFLDNSIRHGEHVSEIRVSSSKSDDCLKIIWEDNGVGIPADEKEKIFERGFGKNTGLGLFLVKDILSLTGISIKETGKTGEGARFEITVPKGMYRIKS